jgi:hypothetical protein
VGSVGSVACLGPADRTKLMPVSLWFFLQTLPDGNMGIFDSAPPSCIRSSAPISADSNGEICTEKLVRIYPEWKPFLVCFL